MQCTQCGKVWCPGEKTICSNCSGSTVGTAIEGGPASPDDFVGVMIPTGNKPALIAYYLGLFSLLPCLGIPMGITAVVLGIKGLRLERRFPAVRGGIHAWVGIVLGGVFALGWTAATILVIVGMTRAGGR
jgi:hypothetical protein